MDEIIKLENIEKHFGSVYANKDINLTIKRGDVHSIVGENGAQRKYYVVRQISGDFILRDDDIAAIVRSAKASMSPVAAYMRHVREQQAAG